MKAKCGDTVRLITKKPSYGLGGAVLGDMGIVSYVDSDGDITVDFPNHHGWCGRHSDISVLPKDRTKHIKYKAELVKPEFKVVRICITSQTDRGRFFGLGGHDFEHEGFKLRSTDEPCGGFRNRVYLRGTDHSADDDSILIEVDVYPAFKAAVEAYNAFFSGTNERKSETPSLRNIFRRGEAPAQDFEKPKEPWQLKGAWNTYVWGRR